METGAWRNTRNPGRCPLAVPYPVAEQERCYGPLVGLDDFPEMIA